MATTMTLQARKQQLVREAIWESAMDLFARRGFDETTVEEIAEAAGVSRRSFFRYFASKNDLMAHGMTSYGADLTAAIEACPKDLTLQEVFREVVAGVARNAAAHPRTKQVLGILRKYPEARSAELSRLAEVQDQVAKALLKRCRQQGEDALMASIVARMTLQMAGLSIVAWHDGGCGDVEAAVEGTFSRLDRLLCDVKRGRPATRRETYK